MKQFYVYIMVSRRNGTLYTGLTSNLIKRVYQHKNGLAEGFTKKFGVHFLIWYEIHQTADTAFMREKQIKKWNRSWTLELIEKDNPEWLDLYSGLVNEPGFPLPRE